MLSAHIAYTKFSSFHLYCWRKTTFFLLPFFLLQNKEYMRFNPSNITFRMTEYVSLLKWKKGCTQKPCCRNLGYILAIHESSRLFILVCTAGIKNCFMNSHLLMLASGSLELGIMALKIVRLLCYIRLNYWHFLAEWWASEKPAVFKNIWMILITEFKKMYVSGIITCM